MMKKYEYANFIPENVAPKGATKLLIKDQDGNVVTTSPLWKLKPPSIKNKLYSFGVLSDVHVNPTASSVAATRFKNAVKYLADEEKVDFICITGDLTNHGTDAHFKEYINLVQTAKTQCTNRIEIHDTTGNHDVEYGFAEKSYLQAYADGVAPYDTRELYYSFTMGNDVFIMFGMTGWPGKTYNSSSILYSDESIAWLENTLEANKGKRCFLFSHPPYFTVVNSVVTSDSGSGAIIGLPPPTGNYINKYSNSAFKTLLLQHDVIWLHGHSHMEFLYQLDAPYVNYYKETFGNTNTEGIHSIHVPSLAFGRQLDSTGTSWGNPPDIRGGEGYIVDVYPGCIHLRGYNFAEGTVMPIATYCLDTILTEGWETPKYTITWVVDGETTTESYEAGETPSFKGSTDKKSDGQYDYTFIGWDPAITTVDGDTTYTAQYSQTVIEPDVTKYSITLTSDNCTSNGTSTAEEGATYTTTLTAKSGYALPQYISVSMGDDTLDAGTGYSYDKDTGLVTIHNVTDNIDIVATVTNWIPISTNKDGTSIVDTNGIIIGYKTDTRVSLSSGGETTTSGYECTGYIAVVYGDTIILKNVNMTDETTYNNIVFYDKDYAPILCNASSYGSTLASLFTEKETGVYTSTLTNSLLNRLDTTIKYVRIGSKVITSDSICNIQRNGIML